MRAAQIVMAMAPVMKLWEYSAAAVTNDGGMANNSASSVTDKKLKSIEFILESWQWCGHSSRWVDPCATTVPASATVWQCYANIVDNGEPSNALRKPRNNWGCLNGHLDSV
jgi:hypothetical protein